MFRSDIRLHLLVAVVLNLACSSTSVTRIKFAERTEIPSLDEILSENVNANGSWKPIEVANDAPEGEERSFNVNFDHDDANSFTDEAGKFKPNSEYIDNFFLDSDKSFLELQENIVHDNSKELLAKPSHRYRNQMTSLDDVLDANAYSNGTWKIPDSENDIISTDKDYLKDKDLENNLNVKSFDLEGSDTFYNEQENNDLKNNDFIDRNNLSPKNNLLHNNYPSRGKLPALHDVLAANVNENGTWMDQSSDEDITYQSEYITRDDKSYYRDITHESNLESTDHAFRDEIIRNLPNLIMEGVRIAEKLLDENKAAENTYRDAEGKKPVRLSSHARQVDPESRELGYCRGLALTETIKLVAERYNITKNKFASIWSSIPIESYLSSLKTKYCRQKRQGTSAGCNPNFPYRTITGRCNNLTPGFIEKGASNTPFGRFLPPTYGDGVNSMRGDERTPATALPNARAISRGLSLITDPPPDVHMTQMLKAWGQTVDHDLTFTLEGNVENCCDFGTESSFSANPDCRPIDVRTDPFYSQFNINCVRLVRSVPTGSVPREQTNTLTSFVDASMVYGSTTAKADELREFVSGRLKENSKGEDGACSASRRCSLPLLPERRISTNALLFDAGDVRVNEQPGLIALHTLFLRFHNNIAAELKRRHINFNDSILYEETRRIVIAVIQHITYNEFLPLLIGKSFSQEFDLYSLTSGHFKDYDPTIDPSIRNVFATAALRIGHTIIGKFISGRKTLALETVFNHGSLMRDDPDMSPSHVLKGECKNPSERYDVEIVDAVVNKLMAQAPFTHGSDLISLNIQRGRDHGLPSYNAWRRFCGKAPFESFDQMKQVLNPDAVEIFRRFYRSVDDVDIFPGGLSEFRTTFGFIGETFSCIIARQMFLLKHGDRFWYEYSGQPKPFTEAQLTAIRNSSLAAMICSASAVSAIQPYPMLSSQLRKNEERPCADFLPSSVINQIALHW